MAATLIQQIDQMDKGRLAAYKTNLAFYNADQWLSGTVNRAKPWQRRLTMNYARVLIDKLTSYLMSEINFAVDPTDDTEASKDLARRAEEALYRVYDRNHLAQLDFDTEIDTAILGDGCYKVTWDPAIHDVRVSAPDVQGIYVWWMGDDVSRIWRLASRYVLTADELDMLHGIRITKATTAITEIWTVKEFELWIGGELFRTQKNPYGFIPFVIYPNIRTPKKFWGMSDIPQIVEPARELNRSLSQLSMILELSGNPIAVLENVDRAEDLQVEPGQVWEIPEKAKAYLLDLLQGGGVKLHVDYIDLIYRTLHDLSEAPRTAFGDNQRALSGVALEMELHPLLQKVRRKRLIRSIAYTNRNEMILSLSAHFREGKVPGSLPHDINFSRMRNRVIWGPVLPQDRQRMVDDETKLITAGIHTRARAADELGVANPEREFRRWLEEEKQIRIFGSLPDVETVIPVKKVNGAGGGV